MTNHSIVLPSVNSDFLKQNRGALGAVAVLEFIRGIGVAMDQIAWERSIRDVLDPNSTPDIAIDRIAWMRDVVNRPRGVYYAITNVNNPDRDKDLNEANAWLDELEAKWLAVQYQHLLPPPNVTIGKPLPILPETTP